jgi:hypothetical protein
VPRFDSAILRHFPVVFDHFRLKHFPLLYRGSRDGFDAAAFHKRCDGHANTIGLISDSGGSVFGFFVSMPWSSDDCRLALDDRDDCFLFTVTNPHKSGERRFPLNRDGKRGGVLMSPLLGPVILFEAEGAKLTESSDSLIRKMNEIGDAVRRLKESAVEYRETFDRIKRREPWPSDEDAASSLSRFWELADSYRLGESHAPHSAGASSNRGKPVPRAAAPSPTGALPPSSPQNPDAVSFFGMRLIIDALLSCGDLTPVRIVPGSKFSRPAFFLDPSRFDPAKFEPDRDFTITNSHAHRTPFPKEISLFQVRRLPDDGVDAAVVQKLAEVMPCVCEQSSRGVGVFACYCGTNACRGCCPGTVEVNG